MLDFQQRNLTSRGGWKHALSDVLNCLIVKKAADMDLSGFTALFCNENIPCREIFEQHCDEVRVAMQRWAGI